MTDEATPGSALVASITAQQALTRVFVCADRRDWDGLRTVLHDTVALDYTSLNGGNPSTITADDLLAAWRQTLGGFEATQHLLGSFVTDHITASEARLRFYAIATHVLHAGHGDPIWTVAGHYDAELNRADGRDWQLTALTLHTDWVTGNQRLADLARQHSEQ